MPSSSTTPFIATVMPEREQKGRERKNKSGRNQLEVGRREEKGKGK
jgi:hypothetical protein